MKDFYVGFHRVNYLKTTTIPLFISDRLLRDRKSFPIANHKWALDSGGFTQLNLYNEWPKDAAKDYIQRVKRYEQEIGLLQWIAPQDWMCEPFVTQKTKKTVSQHQINTVENYIQLRAQLDNVIPVIQGYTLDEYLACIELYYKYGIDLTKLSLVGLGSICRRSKTDEAAYIITQLHKLGIKIHGFGLKKTALYKIHKLIKSADSMAWSYTARREQLKLETCTHPGYCNNCYEYAKKWYKDGISIYLEK